MGYLLTNVGEWNIPDAMKAWIEDMEFYVPGVTSPIVCGMNSVGDRMTLCFSQSFDDDSLIRTLCQVCSDNGLDVVQQNMGLEEFDKLGFDAVKRLEVSAPVN